MLAKPILNFSTRCQPVAHRDHQQKHDLPPITKPVCTEEKNCTPLLACIVLDMRVMEVFGLTNDIEMSQSSKPVFFTSLIRVNSLAALRMLPTK